MIMTFMERGVEVDSYGGYSRGVDNGYAAGGKPFDERLPRAQRVLSDPFYEGITRVAFKDTLAPMDLDLESPEAQAELDDQVSGRLTVVSALDHEIGPGADVAKRYMSARLAYVIGKGWMPTTLQTDIDEYDLRPDTKFLMLTEPETSPRRAIRGELIAGIRITPVTDVRKSLSWNMFATNDYASSLTESERFSEIRQMQLAARRGDLYDMTRVVPGENPDVRRLLGSGFQQLFGAALSETVVKQGGHPLWMFMITDELKRFLESSGIRHATLYSGVLTLGDKEASHLCVADPIHAFNYLRNCAADPEQAANYLLSHERSSVAQLRRAGKNVLAGALKNID